MNPTPYLLYSLERINAETGHRCPPASSRPTKPPQLWYCGYAAATILIPTYYVASNMGRQHTTWISDETWDRLRNIEGDSISKKLSNAVKYHDPDNVMRINAQLRQLITAKKALRNIANSHDQVEIDLILSECDWLWAADIRD
jgi:hypothetical protein